MTTEEQIKTVKQLRVDIDKNIQEVRELQLDKGMAEKTLALRKLQEGKMWLGQVLSELGNTTPYIQGSNPENAIVEPTAEVYQKPVTVKDAKLSFMSIHFSLKANSEKHLKNLLEKLTTTRFTHPSFQFNENMVVLHTFLPKLIVQARGMDDMLYKQLLDPFFKNQRCLFTGNMDSIRYARQNLMNELKEKGGTAVFLGELVDGVKEEWDLAKESGVKTLLL